MSAGLVLGGIAFALSRVNEVITIVKFIDNCIKDSKAFGKDVRGFHTRITTEVARLNIFQALLNEEDGDVPRFTTLPSVCQDAILGLIQELEVAFASYRTYVNENSLGPLQQFYNSTISLEDQPLQIEQKATRFSESTQRDASLTVLALWGLWRKSKLTKLLSELQGWNDQLMNLILCGVCFGPTTPLRGNRQISNDQRLATGLNLRKLRLEQGDADSSSLAILGRGCSLLTTDPYRRVQTLVYPEQEGHARREEVLVEFKPYTLARRRTEPSDVLLRRVASLANLLALPNACEAGFRTLTCLAVVRQQTSPPRFVYAFRLPQTTAPGFPPRSLLDLIGAKGLDIGHRPSLEERFAVARCLTTAVFQMHSVDWLHKSIRSENVLFGHENLSEDPAGRRPSYTSPYLVGFEFSREQSDITSNEQDGMLIRNLYRHPDRQGAPEDGGPEIRFGPLHDLYAIGVVMLEIGLWRPAMEFEKDYGRDPWVIRGKLQEHAAARLPFYMGQDYTNAVLACLKGSFGTGVANSQAVSELKTDEERASLNIAFFENVIQVLKLAKTDKLFGAVQLTGYMCHLFDIRT
ncbi:hypothetical protein LTR56_008352 [Elasticomyces elasticus]|nr:hypothetical protein LTR56_008352 [Elasticomyces elasticus]KAK3661488.1 hypothetical protein LTR22_007498 [Elasticomyces elasticus]KAK4926155.1 hypothetical protein LTR49_006859 [Elasticomyces elasticus]KAK5756909.1 hypothetical protein LTS12_012988 [Elasticomyces elasticus]